MDAWHDKRLNMYFNCVKFGNAATCIQSRRSSTIKGVTGKKLIIDIAKLAIAKTDSVIGIL